MGTTLSYPEVDLKNKVAIVTGGNTGIGYETVKALCRLGAHVVLACRSEERALEAIEKLKTELSHENPDKEIKVGFMALDLSSLASADNFAKAFLAKELPLHLLILNAGVAMLNPRQVTDDGFEKHFQVNYLGHLLILLHVLERLKSSGPDARVISVSSAAYKVASYDITNVDGSKSYGRMGFYGNSKLYQIMMTYYLQRALPECGISFFALHPGMVNTEITRGFDDSKFWMFFTKVIRGLGGTRSAEKGAATTINAAVNPEYAGQKALYFESCKPVIPGGGIARNERHQEELWKYSIDLLRRYLDVDALAKVGLELLPATVAAESAEPESSSERPQTDKDSDKRNVSEDASTAAANTVESAEAAKTET
eukprot:m.6992 g.6992  ORF g.6992 m.6992 type:complete len:369 (+) comp17439_c0_seq1:33-1139(+)